MWPSWWLGWNTSICEQWIWLWFSRWRHKIGTVFGSNALCGERDYDVHGEGWKNHTMVLYYLWRTCGLRSQKDHINWENTANFLFWIMWRRRLEFILYSYLYVYFTLYPKRHGRAMRSITLTRMFYCLSKQVIFLEGGKCDYFVDFVKLFKWIIYWEF